eukprot:3314128-Pyramimonas_sp.AAC.1
MRSPMCDAQLISVLAPPKVGEVYPANPVVINAAKDFMPMGAAQVASLREAAGEIMASGGRRRLD